jgi:sugar phosphate isomerase/epimerase
MVAFSLPSVNWLRHATTVNGAALPTQPMPRFVAAAAANGFAAVGLDRATIAHDLGQQSLPELTGLLEANRLRCSEVGVLNVGARSTLTAAIDLAELARSLNAPTCITLLEAEPTPEVIARVRDCADVLTEAGAKLAFEFVPFRPLRTLPDAISLCDSVGWDRCGLVIDVWHFFHTGAPWHVLRTLTAAQVLLVQLNDAPSPISDDLVHECRFRRVPPGLGTFDLARFVDEFAPMAYEGVVSAEVLNAAALDQPCDVVTRTLYETSVRTWHGL